MKIISWNCRGLGNQTTVRALKKILNCEGPSLIFLMETRLSSQQMQQLNQAKIKFAGCLPNDCTGEGRRRSGGLCVLWNDEVEFDLISFSTNHILGKIKSMDVKEVWYFSGIYGWPENTNKWRTWDLMNRIRREQNEPWMSCGDFNEIFWSHEKCGGGVRSLHFMNLFQQTMTRCNLVDLGFTGHRFTWSNGRKGADNIQERLDRALANESWRMLFPSYQVKHLYRISSDHAPLLISFDTHHTDPGNQGKRKKRFRFENMWLQHPHLENLVKHTWQQRPAGYEFGEKIKTCGQILMEWDQTEFGNIRKKIKQLKENLEKLQHKDQCEWVVNESHRVEDELNYYFKLEETMWFQRSRALWLNDGDKNAKFFHNKASQRKRRNSIQKIRNDEGVLVTNQKEVEKVILLL